MKRSISFCFKDGGNDRGPTAGFGENKNAVGGRGGQRSSEEYHSNDATGYP